MKKIIVLFIMGVGSVASASIVEWSVDVGGNGHFYEAMLVPEMINWDSANIAANNQGGYLATLTSPEENIFVFNLIKDNIDLWQPNPHSSNPNFISHGANIHFA